jgi:malonate-semialdehyde dehydrogenase (acetylating)/methylmalonate-semialdehyde dehydrogenase
MVKNQHNQTSEDCFRVSSQEFRINQADGRLQHLIRQHTPEIARSIVLEQGKTFADAHGDVHRGLQVVESSTAITSTLMGDKLEVAKDMDTYSRRLPLGVCAAITPFNFPAM